MERLYMIVILLFEVARATSSDCKTAFSAEIIIDGYTPVSVVDSPATLPLGSTLVLVARAVGLPHGTHYNYTWTCPNGPCNIGQGDNPNRRTYHDRLLINILSPQDGGEYTCQVEGGGDQVTTSTFTLTVQGGTVIHSNGNLLPNNAIIVTDTAIDNDGNVNISCTVMGTTNIAALWRLETTVSEDVTYNSSSPVYQYPDGTISTSTRFLIVNMASYQNTRFRCSTAAGQDSKWIFLYLGGSGHLEAPMLTVTSQSFRNILTVDQSTINKQYQYYIARFGRSDLGVPLEVEYQGYNGRTIDTIYKPTAIPGVAYNVTVWSINGGNYSYNPFTAFGNKKIKFRVQPAISRSPRCLKISRYFADGFEVDWLPPRLPNGVKEYSLYLRNTQESQPQIVNTISTFSNITQLKEGNVYELWVAVGSSKESANYSSNATIEFCVIREKDGLGLTVITNETACQQAQIPQTNSSFESDKIPGTVIAVVVVTLIIVMAAAFSLLIVCIVVRQRCLSVVYVTKKEVDNSDYESTVSHRIYDTPEGIIIKDIDGSRLSMATNQYDEIDDDSITEANTPKANTLEKQITDKVNNPVYHAPLENASDQASHNTGSSLHSDHLATSDEDLKHGSEEDEVEYTPIHTKERDDSTYTHLYSRLLPNHQYENVENRASSTTKLENELEGGSPDENQYDTVGDIVDPDIQDV